MRAIQPAATTARSRRTRHHLGSLVALAVASCVSAPNRADGLRQVRIANTTGGPIYLYPAQRDGWGAAQPVNGDLLALPPGRWALGIGDGPPQIPLPLPRAELGFAPPERLELLVAPWPAPEEGWCWIPRGPGLRGDDLGIGQEDERPVSTPDSCGVWLAAHETTNAQFVTFLNDPSVEVDRTWLDLEGPKCRIERDTTTGAFVTDAPEHPVVTVSWTGARAYCAWRTATTGLRHRLPTETEWEKAARGPGSRVYAYGDTFRTDAANQESGRLVAVGQFAPNGFGLFDMTGNAFEWTADRYHRGAYGGELPAADQPQGYRALRGGSFVLDGIFVRNSMRMRLRPGVRADDVGFRVLREPSQPRP